MNPTDFGKEVQVLADSLSPMAYHLTGDKEDAKDLIRETAYKALVHREKFHKGTNLKAWLYTIMKNIFINNYRREAKKRLIMKEKTSLLLSEATIAKNKGESSLIMREIERALAAIDEALRIPFLMHYRGFKYEEIASHMRIPLGTVKSRIFFARKELQSRLKDYA